MPGLSPGVCYIPKPLGVIGCIMPSTNPIVTIHFPTAWLAIKCRNAVIVAPHPAFRLLCPRLAVNMIARTWRRSAPPTDIIQTISPEMASIAATNSLLHQLRCQRSHRRRAMVKAVYSSGKPALAWDRATARPLLTRMWRDYGPLAGSIIFKPLMGPGFPCTGEQTVHVPEKPPG